MSAHRLSRAVAIALAFLTLAAASIAVAAAPPASSALPASSAAAPPDALPAGGVPAEGAQPVFAWKPGPAKIDLGHDLDLALPDPYVFLPMPDAAKLLEKLGNFHNDDLLGIVASKDEAAEWIITVRYEEAGYIKDDETIDADELLNAIREGTEEANKERVERGFKALHVGDWSDPPRYDKAKHHLTWALNATSELGTSVNFNTRVLGRRGYVALNLVTDPTTLAADKVHAAAILAATSYRAGARYEDFDEKKDKVAEYGLIGLILGGAGLGAAKLVKIGLLAKFWKVIVAVLIAGKKAIIALLAAGAAFFKRLFGGKKAEGKSDAKTP